MSFSLLNLSPEVMRAITAAGYTAPTPVQERAIPVVLAGRDLIASAQTGTGKTAAFALPILTRLGTHKRAPRVLILEPTRELAAQVEEAFRGFAQFTDLKTVSIFGGVGYGAQRSALKNGVDVVAATPGRLMDFLQTRDISLQSIEILVLDEVDRMLDMGFLPTVRDIIGRCPRERQTLFFSATVPPEIAAVAAFALRKPERVEVGINRSVNQSVRHALYPVAWSQKYELLAALLKNINAETVLVFSRTKHGADKIAKRLKIEGHAVAVLHANRSQNQRTEALAGFKSGRYKLMVATDIAARGIDVAGVTHVINYDVPENPEDYVHRIGRTGRAMAVGEAFTLVSPENADDIRAIQRFIGSKIPEVRLEGFPYAALAAKPVASPQQPARGQRGPRSGQGYGSSTVHGYGAGGGGGEGAAGAGRPHGPATQPHAPRGGEGAGAGRGSGSSHGEGGRPGGPARGARPGARPGGVGGFGFGRSSGGGGGGQRGGGRSGARAS